MTTKKKRKNAKPADDFRVVCQLPERLARHLRELLHVDKAAWDFCLDKIRQKKEGKEESVPRTQRLYREWAKSKGRGKGKRYFAAPCEALKLVQKALELRFLKQIPVHFVRYGNQEGSSILQAVEPHRGHAFVFSVDIVNAFPSVFRSRIRANLKKPLEHRLRQFTGVNFSEEDAGLLLDTICDLLCLRDRLPQGPPTSPRILDIVCLKLDMDLYKLMYENSTPFQEYRLTAWADDLTISSSAEIPEELRMKILETIKANGFIPHSRKDKTVYYSPETGEVPVILGLVINRDGRITMAPGKVNQLRARFHNLLKRKKWDDDALGVVNGTLGFVRQVYPVGKKLPSKLEGPVFECESRLAAMKGADLSTGWISEAAHDEEQPKKSSHKRGKNGSSKPRRTKDESCPFDAVEDASAPVSCTGSV